jgi:hypothetical protein
MDLDARIVDILESMDKSLREINGGIGLLVQRSNARAAAGPPAVAPDRDLDSKYGDPQVKSMPRDWTGPSFVGRKMSECPPALLDMLAERSDYLAKKADENHERTDAGKPVSQYRLQDAARARGWAKRMRTGRAPTPVMDRAPAPPMQNEDPPGAFRNDEWQEPTW